MGERRKTWLEKAMKKRREANPQGTDEYFGVGDYVDESGYDPNNPPAPPPPKKKKCFVTTLFVDILGKGDDCPELRTLRWFRDMVLAKSHPELLVEYATVGPRIVDAVGALEEKSQLHVAEAHWPDIKQAVSEIESGDFETAVDTYRLMVTALQHELELVDA
jgi:hypothetical protein